MAEGLSSVLRLLPVMYFAGLITSTTLFLGIRQGITFSGVIRPAREEEAVLSNGTGQLLFWRPQNEQFSSSSTFRAAEIACGALDKSVFLIVFQKSPQLALRLRLQQGPCITRR